jgi:hypothetical protein
MSDSSYEDTVLWAMFSYAKVFDELLHKQRFINFGFDAEKYTDAKRTQVHLTTFVDNLRK